MAASLLKRRGQQQPLLDGGCLRLLTPIHLGALMAQDIDVLLQQRSLIHFTGDARSKWGHAIRGGLEMEQPGSPPAIVDWWGKQDFYIRRSTNRISVVVAFGEKE